MFIYVMCSLKFLRAKYQCRSEKTLFSIAWHGRASVDISNRALIGEFPSGNCYCKWVSIVAIRLLLNKGGFNIFRHLWHNVCTAYLDTWLHFVKLESLFTRISLGDSSWGVTTTTPVLMLMLIFVPNSSLSTRDLKRDDVNTRNSYWSFVILVRFLIITC